MMRWKLKAHGMAVLSRIPAGRTLYHLAQRVAGTNGLDVERDLRRAFELVDLVHEGGGTASDAVCLEVGTGWWPIVPMVLALGGARRVVTMDINPWLTEANARHAWRRLGGHLTAIAAVCRVSEDAVRRRYAAVAPGASTLRDLLGPLGIEYVYPGDARCTGLADGSVDVVLSSNVLEHIPRDIQGAVHRESVRVLRRGGLAVHRFNPEDHYAPDDPRITAVNFLQYSEREWHWYGGSGLSYHNRLRAPDFREMFGAAGFAIEICRVRTNERALEALRSGRLMIDEAFRQYPAEELAVDYMWVACRKPACSATAEARTVA